jgi:hypothetical protein
MVPEFFRLMTDEEVASADASDHHPKRLPGVQCSCGWFAKYLRTEHYYNGNWDCKRLWVRCSRCGDVGIELV